MASLATPGVVNPSTDFIVTPGSGINVNVSAGAAYVQQTVAVENGGNTFYNGLYEVFNDAAANPVNTVSAPVSNPRIDQVILRVYDVQEQGLGGSSKDQIEWLPGTENASASLSTMGLGLSNPGAASLPANSMLRAYVLQTVGEVSISSGNILNVDINWVPLTLVTNFVPTSGAYTPSIRIRGNRAEFKGAITNSTGSAPSTGTQFASFSSSLAPTCSGGVKLSGRNGTNDNMIGFIVTSGGLLQTSGSAWANSVSNDINGLGYSIN